jgi:hypothetical protein
LAAAAFDNLQHNFMAFQRDSMEAIWKLRAASKRRSRRSGYDAGKKVKGPKVNALVDTEDRWRLQRPPSLARLSQLGQAGGDFWGWEGAKSESVQR